MWYTHTHTHTHTEEYYAATEMMRSCYFNNMDGARKINAKQNKSIRERQIPYDLTHMWNLRSKTEDHRGREGKIKQDETRGDKS